MCKEIGKPGMAAGVNWHDVARHRQEARRRN